MPPITRRTALSLTALALASPALIGRAEARARTITVASLFGDDKPETKIWQAIAATLEARLPGRFTFNIVKGGALGGEKEVAEGVRLGSIQGSLATVSALSGWVPEAQILDLPFLFRDADHVQATVTGPVGAELKARFSAQQFITPAFINYGARNLLTKTPVTRPEQLAGLKIRVIQSPLHTRLWSAFGTTPVGIPITETYNALSNGVADAMDLTKSAYAGFKLYEVVPCMTETRHIWASGVVYFGAGFWNGLTTEEQHRLAEASQAGAATFNRLIVEDEVRAVETARAHGGQLLQPEALDDWRRGATGVWQDMAGTVGGLDRIHAIAGS